MVRGISALYCRQERSPSLSHRPPVAPEREISKSTRVAPAVERFRRLILVDDGRAVALRLVAAGAVDHEHVHEGHAAGTGGGGRGRGGAGPAPPPRGRGPPRAGARRPDGGGEPPPPAASPPPRRESRRLRGAGSRSHRRTASAPGQGRAIRAEQWTSST